MNLLISSPALCVKLGLVQNSDLLQISNLQTRKNPLLLCFQSMQPDRTFCLFDESAHLEKLFDFENEMKESNYLQ